MVLPAFVIRDGKDWRLVSYEADILSRVRWQEADITPLYKLPLNLEEKRDVELRAGLAEQLTGLVGHGERLGDGALNLDYAYAAGHLLDIVPNPWIGYEFVERVFTKMLARRKGKEKLVANNLVFILEELRKRLEAERDRLAQRVFDRLLDEDKMRFMVVMHDLGMNRPPAKIELPKTVSEGDAARRQPIRVESVRSGGFRVLELFGARSGKFPGRTKPTLFLVSEHSPPRVLRAGLAEVADLCGFYFHDAGHGEQARRIIARCSSWKPRGCISRTKTRITRSRCLRFATNTQSARLGVNLFRRCERKRSPTRLSSKTNGREGSSNYLR